MATNNLNLGDIMPEYPSWDKNTALNSGQQTITNFGGMDSQGNFIASEDTITKGVDFQAVAGHTTEQLANIESLFQQKVSNYLDDTGSMILMNDLANANKFAGLTVENETKRLMRLKERSASDLTKTRAQFLSKNYTISYNRYLTSIVQLSFAMIIVVAISTYCLIPANIIGIWVYGWIIGIIAVIYIIAIIIMIKNMQSRRKDDWDKYYFIKS